MMYAQPHSLPHTYGRKKGDLVLEGTRKLVSDMCNVHLATTLQPIPIPTNQSENNLIEDRNKPEMTQWYHTALFSPVKKTLIKAIKKGYFARWPNLTIDLINKHIPPSMETSKVHMHQTRKNIKFTR